MSIKLFIIHNCKALKTRKWLSASNHINAGTLTCWNTCCCWVASVMSDSVQPHRRQPTRLPRLWDSPGKNTGVGCHFLLQCMKVKSESEVAQSYPTLCNPIDCSPPGSSVHGIFQARVLEWVPLPSPVEYYATVKSDKGELLLLTEMECFLGFTITWKYE